MHLNRRVAGVVGGVLALVALSIPIGSAASQLMGSLTRGSATLSGDVLPHIDRMRDLGSVPAGMTISLPVSLTDPNLSTEQHLYTQIYNPRSPAYHQFLTPAEYEARFSAPDSQVSAVRSFLTGGGLTVTYTSKEGRSWLATGRAADVEQLFHVSLRSYRYGNQTFYANDRAPSVPGGLGVDFVGLTNAIRTGHDLQVKRAPAYSPNAPGGFAMYPQDLWSAYDQPSSNLGQGQSLAIIGDGTPGTLEADLRAYEKTYNLPQIPLHFAVVSTMGAADLTGDQEFDLDLQSSSGMAPKATAITVYLASAFTAPATNAAMQYWADDPQGASQISASFGSCEDNPAFGSVGLGYAKEELAANLQATVEGRTLFASAGDWGAFCQFPAASAEAPGDLPFQSMPAADPYVVAVGGTILYPDITDTTGTTNCINTGNCPNARRLVEYAWDATGGGPSVFESQPAYQTGVVLPTACASSPSGGTSQTGQPCRALPDVAAMSGDLVTNSWLLYNAGAWFVSAGTSLSAPLMQGMWARINAAAPRNPKTGTFAGLGFANEAIYKDAESSRYAADFYDIAAGDNRTWPALPGWDFTSGWGVPDVKNLMQSLAGSLVPANPNAPIPALPIKKAPALAALPVTAAACGPVWTDPPGDTTDPISGQPSNQPNLDLLRGEMSLTPDEQTLRIRLTIANLDKTIAAPYRANEYYGFWNYKGTTYYGNAEVEPSGAVYYTDGTFAAGPGGGSLTPAAGLDSGKFGSGSNGVVEIDVAAGRVGSPAIGAALTNTGAQTGVIVGTNQEDPTATTVGSLYENFTVDSSPLDSNGNFAGRTYQYGEECVPPTGSINSMSVTERRGAGGVIATFQDPRAGDRPNEFQATIDWGDGTSTAAGVVGGGAGSLTVSGGHTWGDEGSFPLKVTLTQTDDPHRPAAVASAPVKVADADSISASAATIACTAGSAFSGTVATFTNSDTSATSREFGATVDWGDGTTSYGYISGSGGAFTVTGSHTYGQAGTYTVRVVVYDPGGAAAVVTATAKAS